MKRFRDNALMMGRGVDVGRSFLRRRVEVWPAERFSGGE